MSSRSVVASALLGGSFVICLALAAGCARGTISETAQGPTTEQLISLLSPRSVRILPFTKPRSFSANDAIPDGIAVSLQLSDAAGDPIKFFGVFNFELYAYRPATSEHRGELLQTWTQPITTLQDQKQFWEHVTATYEFQLSWEGKPIEPQKKYILAATFQSPGSERLFTEYEFEFRLPREEIKGTLKGAGGK